jgi:ABC-2 type transport system permease protein
VLFGFALNATVSHLQLGVVDDSHSAQSRDLIATMTQSGSFDLTRTYGSVRELGEALSRGELDAGLAIPTDFDKDLQRGRPTEVQILLNAMNANTAAIGQGYAEGVIQNWNQTLAQGESSREVPADRDQSRHAARQASRCIRHFCSIPRSSPTGSR